MNLQICLNSFVLFQVPNVSAIYSEINCSLVQQSHVLCYLEDLYHRLRVFF